MPVLPTIDENMKTEGKSMTQTRRRRILSTKAADACLDWVIFPALLFIQFGATMYCHAQQGVLNLNWIVVLTAVFCFCVVAGIYRKILRSHYSESLLLLLLPEIATNMLLALVMTADLTIAFEVLIAFTIVLILIGGASHLDAIRHQRMATPQDYQRVPELEEGSPDSDDEWIC